MIGVYLPTSPDGLLEHARKAELPQNTIVSAAGRPREFVGFVRKGRLKTSHFSKNGDEVWLETFSAGQFFAYEEGRRYQTLGISDRIPD